MLSTVYIKGFKTFARPVRMPLEGGVTAIVGPNGSGKSNITDAVLFALGEQSPGLLRAGAMGDLIFSGSDSLPKTNVAEVSLIFDNSSGDISLPYEEVSLTRRISRDGGTEYRINGSRARLSDIRAVSGEAGMGRHSILRQGAVDAIVSGGAEACRQALEEAAGLGVYRRKRLSASRRLEKADAQLERSRNIEAELAAQLKRIEREAVAAREYREIESDYRRLSLASLYRTATRGVDDIRQRISATERDTETLMRDRATLTEQTDSLQNDLRTSESKLHRYEAVITNLENALESLRAESLRAERSRYRLEARRGDAERHRRSVERLGSEAERLRSGVKSLRSRYEQLDSDYGRAVRLRDEADATLSETRRSVAETERRRSTLSARREGLEARLQGMENDASLPKIDLEEAARAERILHGVNASDRQRVDGLLRELAGSRERMSSLEVEIGRRRGSVSAVSGRIESRLRQLTEAGTGSASGLRLYEVVRARPGYEFAVEAALGEFGNGVLATDISEGMKMLSESERIAVRLDAQVMDHEADFRGTPLLDCVEVLDERYSEAVTRLLGGIFVVDDAASSGLNNGHVAVTRQGIRLTRTSVSLAVAGKFAREARLAAYRALLDRVQSEPGAALDDVRSLLSGLSTRRGKVEVDVRTIESRIGRARQAMSLISRETARRKARIERSWAAAAERRESSERFRREHEEISRELDDLSVALTEARKLLGSHAARRDETHIEAEKFGRERRRLRNAISDGARRIDGISRTLGQTGAAPENREAVIQSASTRLSEAASTVAEVSRKRLGSIRMERAETSERYRRRSSEQADLARRAAELDARISASTSETERLRLDLARTLESADEAEQEISDEWNATLDDARLESEANPADIERDLAKLSRRLKRFGDVNLLALSQQEEIQQRYETISSQRADAEAASDELNRIIHSVDEEIEARFTSTFGRVSSTFRDMVPQMLAGASGTLDLSEEGVDIGLRLGRKGWRSLKVLSGGERSLLALSFLFSILLSRRDESGTFCILDEAEAALDDVNLARFISVVDSHRDKGQFLLVTHQKRTMAAADVLYGVIQDASGATSVVSKRIQGD